MPTRPVLVLGVDGGGSHVRAVLADAVTGAVVGRGEAGPANLQAVGVDAALSELDKSITAAFRSAGLGRAVVASACLGLAGVDWENGLDVIHAWADRVGLAGAVSVANDSTLLLAAGTPDGWGLAVIAGTGSIAFARRADGVEGRAGGWGYLLGDEGSGFQIALGALRAVARSLDGCGPPTALSARLASVMGVASPAGIIDVVYRGPWDRAALARLAPDVLATADAGDETAGQVVRKEATALARTAAAAVRGCGLSAVGLPVALAGGVLLGSESFRRLFLEALTANGVTPGPVARVEDPAVGAVTLARRAVTPPG